MNVRAVALTMLFASTICNAQEAADLIGTARVEFQALSARGAIDGCMLNYSVVAQDFAYRRGEIAIAKGAIGLMNGRTNPIFAIKISVSDMAGNEVAPPFAFLRSQTGAALDRSLIGSAETTKGTRMLIHKIDNQVLGLMRDILAGQPVELGFNREQKGLDVTMPIDFTVTDVDMVDGKIKRLHSSKAIQGFAGCLSDVLRSTP